MSRTKAIVLGTLHGLTGGVALNCAICLWFSYHLKLGYYAPCFVALAEPLGGELNAALIQACAFGLIGALIGAAYIAMFRRKRHESAGVYVSNIHGANSRTARSDTRRAG